jgi:hypothetical protein
MKLLHEDTTPIHRSHSNEDSNSKGAHIEIKLTQEDDLGPDSLLKNSPAINLHSSPLTPVIDQSLPKALGTLSISAVVNPGEGEEGGNIESVDPLKAIARNPLKKPQATKSRSGVKRLNATSVDIKMESFENVEKRLQEFNKEMERNPPAGDSSEGDASSSRIATLLRETEDTTKQSIYRTTKDVSSSKSKASVTSTFQGVADSRAAQQKYGNAKSISSDQFFGRDASNNEEILSRLEKLRQNGSHGISSDMLYHDGSDEDAVRSPYRDQTSDLSLEKLKDSVSGFFQDLNKR